LSAQRTHLRRNLRLRPCRTSAVKGFPGTTPISNEDILELAVDVLVPAALEGVIHGGNAANVKARVICELANGPTTPEADEILFANNVFMLPDFLANAGGVTVSYYEWVQNITNYYWEEDEVHPKLDQKMTKAFKDVLAMAKEYEVDMRVGAYMVAIQRVAEAMRLRGWV